MRLAHDVPFDSQNGPDLEQVPKAQGVVRLEFDQGRPYLGKTVSMRRRIERLAGPAASESVRRALRSVEFQPTGSSFETTWRLLSAAVEDWPDDYRRRLRLRCPAFVGLLTANEFPRTTVTTRIAGARTLHFGPFRSRAAAERFEGEILDFFTVRRCVENLEPSADHPGCVYGEIGKCSRPCQAAVDPEEYRAESGRLLEALHTRGRSLETQLELDRDAASESLEFEEAARAHARIEKLAQAMKLAEGPARDIDELHGIVIQRAAEAGRILLWPLYRGWLRPPLELAWEADAGRPVSLDRKLRELLLQASLEEASASLREDHQALLARWMFSNRKRGEMLLFEGWKTPPFRKLVNAVSRVARGVEARDGLTAAMRADAADRAEATNR